MKTILVAILMVALLAVPAFAGKVINFAWDAPTTNEDGTVLDDLAGYNISCGLDTPGGPYTVMVDVGNVLIFPIGGVLSADGLYYCAITAYDVFKNESAYSNEVEVGVVNGNFFVNTGVAPSALGTFRTEK